MSPNPSPDLSALPGGRAVAGASLAGLATLSVQLLTAPALAGLLLAVLAVATATVTLPLGVLALGRAVTAPRDDGHSTLDVGAPAVDERSVAAD